MKATQKLREQLGLSQQDLAQYLSITLSVLGMYEIGKRDLPTAAMVKLAAIELLLLQNQDSIEGLDLLLQKQEVNAKAILAKQAQKLMLKQIREQRALDAVIKKYNQSMNLYRFVMYENETKTTQMDALALQAIRGIEDYGLVAQLKRKVKLQGIESEIELVKQQIEMYEKS